MAAPRSRPDPSAVAKGQGRKRRTTLDRSDASSSFSVVFFFTFYADVDEKTSEGLRVKARPPETGPHSQRRRARPPLLCPNQGAARRLGAPRTPAARPATVHPTRGAETPLRRRLGAAAASPPRRHGAGSLRALTGRMTQGPGVEMGTVQPASSCILQASPPRLGKAGTSRPELGRELQL